MPLFAAAAQPSRPALRRRTRGNAPIVLHVFTGADGSVSLYQDDGVSPAYLKGKFARVPISWDQATRTLTIGAREGGYEGMPGRRAISVRFYGPGAAVAPGFAENVATCMMHEGNTVTVREP